LKDIEGYCQNLELAETVAHVTLQLLRLRCLVLTKNKLANK